MAGDTSLASVVQLVARWGNPLVEPFGAKRSGQKRGREKPVWSLHSTVPQTDTGRRVEDTKALEITLAKELGKLTP